MVSRKLIVNAVSKFITTDLIQGIDDTQVKFALSLVKQNLIDNPSVIDNIFENTFISSVIHEENGMYDIDDFVMILKKVLSEYDSYPITIPKIPLILPSEKTIRIEINDIDKIMSYINSESSTTEC